MSWKTVTTVVSKLKQEIAFMRERMQIEIVSGQFGVGENPATKTYHELEGLKQALEILESEIYGVKKE